MLRRYLNSVAAKYLFRADDIQAGEATAQRFTKDKLTGVSNLHDMQALWYEVESGTAHLRLGNLGMVRLAWCCLSMFDWVLHGHAEPGLVQHMLH